MKHFKIHRVLQLNESPWLNSYINYNTEKRKEARMILKKNCFKLLNSDVFGKTVENLRKRIKIKLTGSEDIFMKHGVKANFLSGKMVNKNLFSIQRIKEQ